MRTLLDSLSVEFCQRSIRTFRTVVILFIALTPLQAQTPKADLLYLQGDYVGAAAEYLNSPSLQGEAKLLAHFKAARAYLQSTHEQDIELGMKEIDFLLKELDADTELFARTLHLRILANFKLGHLQLSLQQLESGKARLFKHTIAEARGICEFLYKIDRNPGIANKCREKLTELYPKAWVLKAPLNLTVAKRNLKSDVPTNGAPTTDLMDSSASSNSSDSSNLSGPSGPATLPPRPKSTGNQLDPKASTNTILEAPESLDKTTTKSDVTPGGFNIQVGAFGKRVNAQTLSENLSFLKKEILIKEGTLGGSKLYLVQITGFSTKDQAEAFARQQVEPEGLTYRVVAN